MINTKSTLVSMEIGENIHWVGFHDAEAGFHCNPYLVIDGDQAILFDPGSVPHFPQVLAKVCKLVDFTQITHIVATHQDPDLCGAIPKFEELIYGNGGSCEIVTHSRASVLIAYYGVRSKFYCIDSNDWKLKLNSGRELSFVYSPFMHFPGAFMTYDKKSKILFSGDIFGGLSFDWSLYANENYVEAMNAFHENYMPSQEIVRNVMEKVEELDLEMIAPQHGSIINKDIQKYITSLKNLEYGHNL